ncbi:hypothetical protein ACF1BP_29365 [Streptomyces sp. NPDC014735]|uniref:hypothetical protein n=1 Tax=unclassified Streptomyces TaxID=2593676 RepID=UPI0036BEBEBA
MPTARKALTSLLSAIVLAGGLAVGAAGQANAATCNTSKEAKIDGAQASWSLTCTNKGVRVSGWVEDTRTDGKCAVVRVVGGGTQKTKKACSSGVREQFDFTFSGKKAEVRLAIV